MDHPEMYLRTCSQALIAPKFIEEAARERRSAGKLSEKLLASVDRPEIYLKAARGRPSPGKFSEKLLASVERALPS
jgi:hypothetical protein